MHATPTYTNDETLPSVEGNALHGNSSDAQFMTFLYLHMLEANPDQAGLNYWVGLLQNGYTRAAIAGYFVTLGQAVAALNPETRIAASWFGVFNTGPSQGSVNYWHGTFQASSLNGILSLLNSGSFAARINLSSC